MTNFRKAIRSNIRQYTMGIALAVLILVLEVVTEGTMLKPLNVTNLILQNMYVFVLGMGMLLCILTGGNIDLSVGSVVAFSAAICGVLMVDLKLSTFQAVPLVLAVGILVGAWHGFWIAVIKVHPWITTLAGELLFRGLAQVILNGRSIGPFPESFQFIATGFFPDIVPGASRHVLTLAIGAVGTLVFIIMTFVGYRRNRRMGLPATPVALLVGKILLISGFINVLTWLLSGYKGASFAMLLLAVMILIFSFITKKIGLRAASVRHGRQHQGGAAVRHQHRETDVHRLHHIEPDGDHRRHARRRAAQFRDAEGGAQLRD